MCQVNQPSNWVAFFFFFFLKSNSSNYWNEIIADFPSQFEIRKGMQEISRKPENRRASRHWAKRWACWLSLLGTQYWRDQEDWALKTWRIESTRSSIFVQREELRVGLKSHIRPITNSSEGPLQQLEPMPFSPKKRVYSSNCSVYTVQSVG